MSDNNKKISRREFVRNTALISGGVALLPAFLTGCDEEDELKPSGTVYTGTYGFLDGIASFDPSATSIILWTRYTLATDEADESPVRWEISESSAFSTLAASGTELAKAANDYTVAANATGLKSNTKYYYRFVNQRTLAPSVGGETRTLPTGAQASSVKLAVVSCANFQAGLFNVYGAVAASDADFVLHLGDYIYEYGIGDYGTNADTARLGRAHLPAREITSVSDYRARYRQYRSDRQLQRAHQLKPFICVWDDHESANNSYVDGAQNHTASTEGTWTARKQASIQVWHEYLPARTTDKNKIYRQFEFGNLVNLLMLDTRLAGRDAQQDAAGYFTNPAAFISTWQNPNRSLLGTEQRTWLTSALGSSSAKWQVLGSQVLMGKMHVPAELLPTVLGLANSTTPAEQATALSNYTTQATALTGIKARILTGTGTPVTPAERARVETVFPYNLDAWDGYPAEREKVYAAAGTKKLISLAGDTHNAWHSDLKTTAGVRVGAEFATPSVSSPGFEALLGANATAISGFEQTNALLIDDLQYLDASKRGFLQVEFTQAAATATYRFMAGPLTTESVALVANPLKVITEV